MEDCQIKHCRSTGSKPEDTTEETIQYETQREKSTFLMKSAAQAFHREMNIEARRKRQSYPQ